MQLESSMDALSYSMRLPMSMKILLMLYQMILILIFCLLAIKILRTYNTANINENSMIGQLYSNKDLQMQFSMFVMLKNFEFKVKNLIRSVLW